jgi:hypothetical protein
VIAHLVVGATVFAIDDLPEHHGQHGGWGSP